MVFLSPVAGDVAWKTRMTTCLQGFRAAALAAMLLLGVQAEAASLPSYSVDLEQTSVSGISSGGFMAVQLHVAHSAMISGVGVLAGGPYACARDSAARALEVCMAGGADAATSIELTRQAFRSGAIDDPANLADDKVWLFSGYNDGVVKQQTMDALYLYYGHFTGKGNVYYRDNLDAGHAQVTPDFGGHCSATGGLFINDCDYDAAGALLQHIYGRLEPTASNQLSGALFAFDQGEFVTGDPAHIGLSDSGYAYVPADCSNGTRCRVHVAFHGCQQNAERIGDAFYRYAGYNEWADGNRIIVLYPQTVSTRLSPFNPNACWDWWGYTDGDYATRRGQQIKVVRGMLERLAGEGGAIEAAAAVAGVPGTPRDLTAVDSADDAVALAWTPVDGAVGYNVYRTTAADGAYKRLNTLPLGGASYGDTGLLPESEYLYAVTAIGDAGESEPAGPVRAVTGPAAPPCDPYFADNVTHTLQGRAYVLFGRTYAKGSNDAMGWWNIFTENSLYRNEGGFRVGTCPAR
jgi:poly(3-hydroxybutyrate) depolymerase